MIPVQKETIYFNLQLISFVFSTSLYLIVNKTFIKSVFIKRHFCTLLLVCSHQQRSYEMHLYSGILVASGNWSQ